MSMGRCKRIPDRSTSIGLLATLALTVVLGLFVVPSVEASPFAIHVRLSDGPGGGRSGRGGSDDIPWGSSLFLTSTPSAYTFARPNVSSSSVKPSDGLPKDVAQSARTLQLKQDFSSRSVALLDLGGGDFLAVSGNVVNSLIGPGSQQPSGLPSGVTSVTATTVTSSTGQPSPSAGVAVNNPTSPSGPATNGVANSVTAVGGSPDSLRAADEPGSVSSPGGTAVDPDSLSPVAADVGASFIASPLEITDLTAADSITAVAMPEPSSLILLASGLAVAARKLRRRLGRSIRDER